MRQNHHHHVHCRQLSRYANRAPSLNMIMAKISAWHLRKHGLGKPRQKKGWSTISECCLFPKVAWYCVSFSWFPLLLFLQGLCPLYSLWQLENNELAFFCVFLLFDEAMADHNNNQVFAFSLFTHLTFSSASRNFCSSGSTSGCGGSTWPSAPDMVTSVTSKSLKIERLEQNFKKVFRTFSFLTLFNATLRQRSN